ncbi:MAG: hypothetical protein A2Y10_05275 [Planctomycetes bacterium GWF2_41_51]|nr:MAG: hypothetical protein A2Y10_05275 [Planctomycetes bacterium GWF2_41_51]HBG25525.1 hypothetical protein [Phycisphaerales bacterium]
MCENKKLVYAITFFLVIGTALAAKEDKQRDKMYKSGMSGKSSMLISGDKIMGKDVTNNMDEKLGTVNELIINQNNDDVQYVLVSSEGMLHPVPWKAIKCGDKDANAAADTGESREKKITLNMSRDQFHQAPTVESADIEQLSDSSLKQRVDSFYSSQMEGTWDKMKSEAKERMPSALKEGTGTSETQGQATLLKFSDIKGLDVQNLNDEKIGSISDIVVDSRRGNLAYTLVNFGGMLGVREKSAAVPWSAISIQPDGSLARLDATEDKLQTAALTESGNISELNQRQFAQRVHEVFGAEPYWQIYGFEAPGESGTQQPHKEMKKEGKDRIQQRKERIEEQEGSF